MVLTLGRTRKFIPPPCLVPVQRFPSPSRSIRFGDVSEANGRETPRQKQNAHACVTFWNLKMSSKQAGSRRFWLLTTLVDICRIDFCRPALKSDQNVIHSPMKIYTAPSISSFQLSYRSLPLANFQSKHNLDPCVVNLDLKSWIIRKTILSNNIH